jgi:hypothetical protein
MHNPLMSEGGPIKTSEEIRRDMVEMDRGERRTGILGEKVFRS